MDVQTILSFNCARLKEELRKLNLRPVGRKDELRNTLLTHYNLTQIDESEDNDEHQEISSNSSAAANYSKYTLRDVQDDLLEFTGTGQITVEEWINEFEASASIFNWNELDRFVYGKQLLKGTAKIFIKSRLQIKSWEKLKEELIAEFRTSISSAEVHEKLANRRKRNNESFLDYLYDLQNIAKNIDLEDASMIRYFANGISDTKQNKLVFYQTKKVVDLKEAIKLYELTREPSQSLNRPSTRQDHKYRNNENKNIQKKRCFNCGDETHLANACTQNSVKCFKCNNWGHRSFECTAPSTSQKKEVNKKNVTPNLNMMKHLNKFETPQLIFKTIKIGNIITDALIDTGCVVSLMRYDTLMMLDDDITLDKTKLQLVGVGNNEISTLGSFETVISADGIKVPTVFHVVAEKHLKFAVIIGKTILNQIDLFISNQDVQFLMCNNINNDIYENNNEMNMEQKFELLCNLVNNQCITNDEIELSHLKAEERKDVLQLIENYTPNEKRQSPIKMSILLTDDIPVALKKRRISYAEEEIVKTQIAKWLKDGIIRPSNSQYAAPVVLVPKKDGTTRLCCDYRMLNRKMIKDNFPMVLIDDVLDKLQAGRVFTTLDLENGFFHVPIEEESRKYTSFVTTCGQYEFMFAPFGLANSPAVFNRYITAIFRELIQNNVMAIYMDDIIIPAMSVEENISNLRVVLNTAQKYGLRIKWRKCQFMMSEIQFLGYIIKDGTIKPSDQKTLAIKNYPLPTNPKALQRFLGLMSYFRRFIEQFAMVAKPLSDLLKKDVKFEIKDEQIIAFNQLKTSLLNAPVLILYDPKAETEVHTDASKFGYGAALMQRYAEDNQMHPVQYMSRKTSSCEEKYSAYELEVLAIVEALKKWRIYILGMKFKLVTDCNAVTMTLNKKDVPVRVSRWVMLMQDFDFIIEHRSGKKMQHVDALSRVSCLMLEESVKHKLKMAQLEDDWIRAVRKVLEKQQYEDFYLYQDVLYKDRNRELMVIPSKMEEEIIKIAHNTGHFSSKKTQEYIEKTYYIPKLATKVANVVRNCVECIITNAKSGKAEGFITPIDKDDRPFLTYHIDHVGPLEATKKAYNYILVVVDAFSKFVWLYPTKTTNAEAVVKILEKQAAIFGNPRRIISDRGTAFTADIFKQYCLEQEIQHLLITTGVPRGNGQVERIHKIIIPMLAKLCQNDKSVWYKHIDKVQQILNNTPPRSTKISPFEIVTGVKMKVVGCMDLQKMLEEELLSELQEERDKLRTEAKGNIQKIQAANREAANKKRKEAPVYKVNDLVAIKKTQFGTGMKLRPKYLGPYKITACKNHDRFEVERISQGEGPRVTTTVAENMKSWR